MGDEIYFVAISVLYGNGSITTINPNTQQYEFNNPDVKLSNVVSTVIPAFP